MENLETYENNLKLNIVFIYYSKVLIDRKNLNEVHITVVGYI